MTGELYIQASIYPNIIFGKYPYSFINNYPYKQWVQFGTFLFLKSCDFIKTESDPYLGNA